MPIPKHEPNNKAKRTKKTRLTLADMPHNAESAAFVDMTSVAEAIDGFASIFSTWVSQERNGDNGASLYSAPSGYPVKIALDDSVTLFLEGDAVDSIADSLKRIADALTKQHA
jgi:hypothetical protein